jgi:Protein of unknown function (DUF2892)
MKTNIGTIDRVIRIIGAVVILGAGYYFKSWWGLVGLLPLLTAVFRFCPGYLPFGFSTCCKNADQPPTK